MKKLALISCGMLFALSAVAQQWPAVKQEARPGARWWWMGSAVDSANLRYNIGEYAKAGLGSVEITPIYGVQGNDANEIPFLSDAWMDALRSAGSLSPSSLS